MPVTLPSGFNIAPALSPDRVRVQWPATATPGTSTLPNLGFESGDVNWSKGAGWAISTGGLVEAGTFSAKYTGTGQSTLAHETLAPVTAGTSITASARVSKGSNRQDFAGGAVVLQWFDNTLASLGFNVGNVVNTGSSAFQTSVVTASAPTGAAYVRLAASATRDVKGRATDAVTIDTLSWNHTFTLGGTGSGSTAPTGPITFTFRVRDANGCEAVATRTIGQQEGSGQDYYSLLRFNGTNGSSTFTDETGITQTLLGSPAISTAQSRFGGASGSFAPGSGLRSPYTLNWTASAVNDTGNWTAEFWLYLPSSITTYEPIFHISDAAFGGGGPISLRISGGGASTNQLYFGVSGVTGGPVSYTVPTGQWVHISIVRYRDITRLYCDGSLAATDNGNAGSMSDGAIWLGRCDPAFGGSSGFTGFIDEFRFIRSAIYSGSTITVPTAQFPYP